MGSEDIMKKIMTVLVVFLIALAGCDSTLPEDSTYQITFDNDSNYTVTISDYFGSDFTTFTLAPDETYILDYEYSTFLEVFDFTNDSRVEYSEVGSKITFSDIPTKAFTFTNNSSYTITVSDSYDDNFDSFSISTGETKTIYSTSNNDSYVLSGTTGIYSVSYKLVSDIFILYQYEFEVEYRISGTATTVDVTLANSSGGTEQYSDVVIPHSYTYKTFSDDFKYISAQNNGEAGSVTVAIYIKGTVLKTSTSSGAYVIATASD
jgi:hypothetical protein